MSASAYRALQRRAAQSVDNHFQYHGDTDYHGLRGSASPVLTANGLVNGKWQFSIPYRIYTPKPIAKNWSQMITSVITTDVLNLEHIRP